MAYNFAVASSQYFEASSSPVSSYPLTIAAWTRLSGNSALYVIGGIATNGVSAQQRIQYSNTQNRFQVVSSDSAGTAVFAGDGPSAPSVGTWYHVAGVVTGSNGRTCYQDGVAGTLSSNIVATTGMDRVLIGARRNNTGVGFYYNGDIAEFAIWNVALAAAELVSLAKGVCPLKIRPASLKVYHPLIRENVAPIGPAFTPTNTPTVAIHPRVYI